MNSVYGFPQWYYGVMIRSRDDTVTFDLNTSDGSVIENLKASAQKLHADGFGYEQVAQSAIRAYEHEVRQTGEAVSS